MNNVLEIFLFEFIFHVSLNIIYDLIFEVIMKDLRIHGVMRTTPESSSLKKSVLQLTGFMEGLLELHVMYVLCISLDCFLLTMFAQQQLFGLYLHLGYICVCLFQYSEIPHTAGWNGNLSKERLYAVYR